MANTNIIPPRVDFIDQRTNKISREWFLFLLEVFRRVGGTTSSESIPDIVVDGYLDAIQPVHGLTPNPFIGVDPQVVGGFPYPQWSANRLEASVAQLRQEFSDFKSLMETAPISRDSGSTTGTVDCATILACLDCDVIEAIGYWTPMTDGSSNILYTDGEVMVTFVCNA